MKKSLILILLFLAIPFVYYFYPEQKLPGNVEVDALIVYKSKKIMEAYAHGILLKKYSIALGRNPVGKKQFEGDNKTPEGIYFINDRNPNSGWHKNLGISYPNMEDITYAKKMNKHTGGDVKIHGLKNDMGFMGKFHR